jgi:hypothetical protein
MAAIPIATRISPDDCACVQHGCGFLAPPRALLDHLVTEHSLRALRITYGEQYQIVVPASERLLLLLAEENDGVFLLAVGEPQDPLAPLRPFVPTMPGAMASKMVALQCLRSPATEGPAYTWTVSAEGLESRRGVTTRGGPARFRFFPSYRLPAMLHGESQAVHLRICISIAPPPESSWKRRVLMKFRCL